MDRDCAAERHNGALDNRKTQTCTAHLARTTGINPVETFEEVRNVLFAYTVTVVIEAEHIEALVFRYELHADFSSARMKGRIPDKTAYHALQEAVIA